MEVLSFAEKSGRKRKKGFTSKVNEERSIIFIIRKFLAK